MAKEIRNSKPRIDLTNQKFDYLTPIEYIKGGKWKCQCRCGKEVIVDTRNLNSGHTKSCGCLQKEKVSNNTIDMTNYENENFLVLSREGSSKGGAARWKCLCMHCGNVFITEGANIRLNIIQSCGCLHSLNEYKIIKLLTDNNIEFATQYTFSDLKGEGGRPLRFDFAIFNNHQLSHLIEYNGLQHYEQAEGSWANSFEILQKHDQKKIQYCKDNNIELRIIKYNQIYELSDLI